MSGYTLFFQYEYQNTPPFMKGSPTKMMKNISKKWKDLEDSEAEIWNMTAECLNTTCT